MIGFWLIAVPMLVFWVAGLASCAPAPPDPIRFFLALGTDDESFEDDAVIQASGGFLPEPVVIMLNDEPIGIHRTGGTLLEINHHLVSGDNRLYLQGTSNQTLYLKVAIVQSSRVRQVQGRWEIAPFEDRTTSMPFNAGMRPNLVVGRGEPADRPVDFRELDQDALRAEIRPFLEELSQLLALGRHQELAERLTEGMFFWSPRAFDGPLSRLESLRGHATRRFEAVAGRFDPIDPDTVTIIPGRTMLMVYQHVGVEAPFQPRITRYEVDGAWYDIGALYLKPTANGWMVWQAGELRH